MKSLDPFFQNDIVHALGWTIIHSFWQGLLIVLVLTASLVLLRRHSSQLRYLAGYLALSALILCSTYTFFEVLSERSAGVIVENSQITSAGMSMDIATAPLSETTLNVGTEESHWQLFIHFIEGNLPFITMVWMLGVLILTLRFLAELAYVQRLKYQPGQLPAAAHQDLLNQLAERMGIRKFIALKENLRVGSPMVIGFFKPVILVPFGLLNRLEPEQVESILAHELAHIRRHDYLLNLFQSLVEIVLFFNPATWWISSFIREEREHCCDEMAIAQTGNQLAFVQTLAKLEEYRLPNSLAPAFNGKREGGVLGRVKRIVNSEETFRIPYKVFWSAIILLCTLGLFAFQNQPVATQPTASEDETNLLRADVVDPAVEEAELAKNTPSIEPEEKITNTQKQDQTAQTDQQQVRAEIPSAFVPKPEEPFLSELDTVPESVKKLQRELMELERSFQEKELALHKQGRDIQTQMLKIEREIKQMENEQMKKVYELEKSAQEIELNRNLQLQELQIEHNALGSEELELQYAMQQLETKVKEQGLTKDLQKEQSDLHQAMLELEKKRRALGLAQKSNDLNIEKEIQLIQNQRWQLEQEAKINQNDKQLEIMELQQQLQEIQFNTQLLQNEKQNKIQMLQMQMQEEAGNSN
jgi:beta-lactamase regulating signal transducer with metallopeptidase domain